MLWASQDNIGSYNANYMPSTQLLTAATAKLPSPSTHFTVYSTISALSSLYIAIMPIYARLISTPPPSVQELVDMDDTLLVPWHANLPSYLLRDCNSVPERYRASHALVHWKYQNLRIITYRPFMLQRLSFKQTGRQRDDTALECVAIERCLQEATKTILSVELFCASNVPTTLGAWYAV